MPSIWVFIFLCIIVSGDIWVSHNCQSKATPCVSSIRNGLLNYPNEYVFNVDADVHWILSGEFSNRNVSFVGKNTNTFILFNNIQCNSCEMKFENTTIIVDSTFIANASSSIYLQNVHIISPEYNNTNVSAHWVFIDNAKFFCNKCWFYHLESLQIQLYDDTIFNA
eukprot:191171_1